MPAASTPSPDGPGLAAEAQAHLKQAVDLILGSWPLRRCQNFVPRVPARWPGPCHLRSGLPLLERCMRVTGVHGHAHSLVWLCHTKRRRSAAYIVQQGAPAAPAHVCGCPPPRRDGTARRSCAHGPR